MYIENVIHQLRFSVESVLHMVNRLDHNDMNFRLLEEKKSIGELVQHLCELIEADLLISKGTLKEEMNQYYQSVNCRSIDEMKKLLTSGLKSLESEYSILTEEELAKKVSSYWGVEYTRFEWLLEILVHFTHHRAQLHMLISMKYRDLNVMLFE
ncbi:DinB family protein [Bacillus sp. EAC]|uniref:DinB family protein n=1 Tax=Bacillus sp. EAC TaxID=1978338 RepID=UPI000B43DF07|nr:DinB family protein [Bacillus sp. EAC]